MMLHQETFPGQIPYRCLLSGDIENLLVPVCLSATHVAWGTVRLEPVFMQTGEAAGFAAALSLQHDVSPARLDADVLVRTLAEHRSMISFFNDVNVAGSEPWIAAVQYFGAKGFVHDYDARPETRLKASTAKVWADGFLELRRGKLDPMALARAVVQSEREDAAPITEAEFARLLSTTKNSGTADSQSVISRGTALQRMLSLYRVEMAK